MASPQLERGYTRIADELLEALIRFDLSKRQYKLALAVIRQTYGYQKTSDVISSSQLADMTGLTDRHCREAVCQLEAIGILRVERVGRGKRLELVKDYERWTQTGPKRAAYPAQNRPLTRPKTGHTKERKTKDK